MMARLLTRMLRTLGMAALLGLLAGPVWAEDITGTGQAIDGDTLKVGEVTLRLYGIDAPELKQTCTTSKGKVQQCGDLARQMLDTLVKNVKVKCTLKAAGAAICFAGPFDINEQMLAAGWAFALVDEVPGYARGENFARARSEGIWRGTFISPAQWRAENPSR